LPAKRILQEPSDLGDAPRVLPDASLLNGSREERWDASLLLTVAASKIALTFPRGRRFCRAQLRITDETSAICTTDCPRRSHKTRQSCPRIRRLAQRSHAEASASARNIPNTFRDFRGASSSCERTCVFQVCLLPWEKHQPGTSSPRVSSTDPPFFPRVHGNQVSRSFISQSV
jgi:hypothetical protein